MMSSSGTILHPNPALQMFLHKPMALQMPCPEGIFWWRWDCTKLICWAVVMSLQSHSFLHPMGPVQFSSSRAVAKTSFSKPKFGARFVGVSWNKQHTEFTELSSVRTPKVFFHLQRSDPIQTALKEKLSVCKNLSGEGTIRSSVSITHPLRVSLERTPKFVLYKGCVPE